MKYLTIAWILAGIATWAKCVYNEGEMRVDDLMILPILAILGPIPAILILSENYSRKIIWKRNGK